MGKIKNSSNQEKFYSVTVAERVDALRERVHAYRKRMSDIKSPLSKIIVLMQGSIPCQDLRNLRKQSILSDADWLAELTSVPGNQLIGIKY